VRRLELIITSTPAMLSAPPNRQETDMHLPGVLAMLALAALGLSGCAFCPAGLEPTAADTAAGLSCHFTPEQQSLREEREVGWRHPAPSSF
jgi:hypothetical protein